MSASADLQLAMTATLGEPGNLRVTVPVIARRLKDRKSDIEAALADKGLCLFVMPPLPTRAERFHDKTVFFAAAEARVRIIEQPATNPFADVDVYDILDDVAATLQGQMYPMLSVPLRLGERPCEMASDATKRVIEVIFVAAYGYRRVTTMDSTGVTMDRTDVTMDATS